MTEPKTIVTSPSIIKIGNSLDKMSPVTLIQQGKLFKLSSLSQEGTFTGLTTVDKDGKPQRQSIRRIFLSKVKREADDTTTNLLNQHDSHIHHNNNNLDDGGDMINNEISASVGSNFQLNRDSLDSTSNAQTIIQYATQGNDGQFYIPVHQLNSNFVSLPQGLVVTPGGAVGLSGGQDAIEEASRKRELRLLKNKEAAKECRRKKKEYVRCLENRVAVLENQNKTLIEELKSLKELYCQKDMHS